MTCVQILIFSLYSLCKPRQGMDFLRIHFLHSFIVYCENKMRYKNYVEATGTFRHSEMSIAIIFLPSKER